MTPRLMRPPDSDGRQLSLIMVHYRQQGRVLPLAYFRGGEAGLFKRLLESFGVIGQADCSILSFMASILINYCI